MMMTTTAVTATLKTPPPPRTVPKTPPIPKDQEGTGDSPTSPVPPSYEEQTGRIICNTIYYHTTHIRAYIYTTTVVVPV